MNRHFSLLSATAALALGFAVHSCRTNGTQSNNEGSSGSQNAAVSDAGTANPSSNNSNAISTQADSGVVTGDSGVLFATPNTPMSDNARRLFAEGSAAYSRRDFSSAARAYRQLYDEYPSVEMAFNLARIYERMGETADAIRFYEIVLRGNPPADERAAIERSIAGIRAYEQRRTAGIAQAPATSAQLNQEGVTWFQRGVRFFQANRYPQALQAFEEAARFLQTPELFYNLGMVHERMHNYSRAIEFLTQFADQSRGSAEEAMIRQHIEELQTRQ